MELTPPNWKVCIQKHSSKHGFGIAYTVPAHLVGVGKCISGDRTEAQTSIAELHFGVSSKATCLLCEIFLGSNFIFGTLISVVSWQLKYLQVCITWKTALKLLVFPGLWVKCIWSCKDCVVYITRLQLVHLAGSVVSDCPQKFILWNMVLLSVNHKRPAVPFG